MKVDVIQAEQATFRFKFSWWSRWVDVAVFNYGGLGYLLQMRVSRTNAKRFKAIQFKTLRGVAQPSCQEVGNLMQMEALK